MTNPSTEVICTIQGFVLYMMAMTCAIGRSGRCDMYELRSKCVHIITDVYND